MKRPLATLTATGLCLLFGFFILSTRPRAQAPAVQPPRGQATAPKPQPRPTGSWVAVDPAKVTVDDGDTVVIHWPSGDDEIVRILGIDTPETRHDEHGIPHDQTFGREAAAFARGAFAAAPLIQLIRSATLDPYGRTLGYLILGDKNYSVLVIRARLAEESVSHYGDNGLPAQASEVVAAAKAAGPPPFEPPHVFRKRMRALSDHSRTSKSHVP